MAKPRQKTRLRRHREELGLTLRQVAQDTGISYSTLSRAEVGASALSRPDARCLYFYYDRALSLGAIHDPIFDLVDGDPGA